MLLPTMEVMKLHRDCVLILNVTRPNDSENKHQVDILHTEKSSQLPFMILKSHLLHIWFFQMVWCLILV